MKSLAVSKETSEEKDIQLTIDADCRLFIKNSFSFYIFKIN
jgi:hypothetical protein|tara:strand:- start:34227 stop:34349 length:123 start_codon:yes stop_codon:yes gene_type:complete